MQEEVAIDVTIVLILDLPPDVPAQYAPIIIAKASLPQQANKQVDHTIGVCHLIENPPNPSWSAVNTISPVGSVFGYLKNKNLLKPDQLTEEVYKSTKLSILQEPKYGNLKMGKSGGEYHPTVKYQGQDRAIFLVEYSGIKVKVLYFFKVMPKVPGGTDFYDPYEDKKNCPNGEIWKISLNPNDPGGGLVGFEPSFSLTQSLTGVIKPKLVFADLPGDAAGHRLNMTPPGPCSMKSSLNSASTRKRKL